MKSCHVSSKKMGSRVKNLDICVSFAVCGGKRRLELSTSGTRILIPTDYGVLLKHARTFQHHEMIKFVRVAVRIRDFSLFSVHSWCQ